jgi:predicted acylesterase/phospholipase RssA
MMNLKKSRYLSLFFLAAFLFPWPSFSSEEGDSLYPKETDYQRDRKVMVKFMEIRNIKDNTPINVLAIDGGGVRGGIPGEFLKKVEEETGYSVNELFDLVVGTSTGAILSLGLLTPIKDSGEEDAPPKFRTAREMVEIYKKLSEKIFPSPGWFQPLLAIPATFWWGSQYPAEPLEEELEVIFGNKALSDLRIPMVLTGVSAEDDSPHLFRSYRAVWDETENFFLKDVTRASTAAPAILPMKQMKPVNGNGPTLSFIDGGLAANNPAAVALSEAYNLFGPRPVNLISLGTGSAATVREAKEVAYVNRATPTIVTLFAAQSHLAHQTIEGLDHSLGSFITYHRVQIPLPESLMPMDCAANVEALCSTAARCFEYEQRRTVDQVSHLLVSTLEARGLAKQEGPSLKARRGNVGEDDPCVYKVRKDAIAVDELLKDLKPTVKTLDLSNHLEIDDSFIENLSVQNCSESLVNIDLSGTSITEMSLKYILQSQVLGTKREFVQWDEKYRKYYSEIYVDVSNTKIEKLTDVKGFHCDVTLRYMGGDGVKIANDQPGIKRLKFKNKKG